MRNALRILFICIVALVGFGIVLVASASSVRAQGLYNDPHFFLKRQLVSLAISVVLFIVAAKFDYRLWKRHPLWTTFLFVVIVFLLLLVLVPGFSEKVNGSRRWIYIAHHRIGQPSEFSKPFIVIILSCWLDRIGGETKRILKDMVISGFIIGSIAGPLAFEPDYGGAVVVGVMCLAIMFIAGSRLWHIGMIAGIGVVLLGIMVMSTPNRRARLAQYFEMKRNATAAAVINTGAFAKSPPAVPGAPVAEKGEPTDVHQLKQSILAFKNGGFWGVGFNQSIQKYSYLPEAHTDFIFSIGGEEFGFLFSMFALVAYLTILFCGFYISTKAQDKLGRLMAFGMTFLLVFQAVFNIGVVTGCLPTKGLALPFLSYGGTSLMSVMLASGVLMNIGWHVAFLQSSDKGQIAKNALAEI